MALLETPETDPQQNEIDQLHAAIAAQENLRGVVPDDVIAATIGILRDKIQALESHRLRTQRKLATVLFADVVGFTAMSEAMDVETVASFVNDLWELVDRAITKRGGRIDKHIGDAVMAVWGTDLAREDDAEQAVRAALDVQEALAGFCETHGLPLTMRVGVNTGPVLLGSVGTSGEYSAMGDTVNLASRLEGLAPTGGILVAHDTYRQIRGLFDVTVRAPILVRGKSEPLTTYIVNGAKPRAVRQLVRGIEGLAIHMVGRSDEQQVLQDAFLDVLKTDSLRMVTIVGEAGVGKSRLLDEFEEWLELRPEAIRYFKGRSSPAMQKSRLGLFRDLFATRYDILESDDPATALRKFRDGMAPYLTPGRADVAGHWLGFDFSTSPAVARFSGSADFGLAARAHLMRFARAVVEENPVVVFFEDIHWADDASLDLIIELNAALAGSRYLIVCVARPTLLERLPDWGVDSEANSYLMLEPLSMADSKTLINEILRQMEAVPDELRDLILNQAEGNPFYIEELVKMLIDDGTIERNDEGWRLKDTGLDALRIPTTLTSVLQARLDGLPREERDTLQRASVVGRLFWDAAVAELAGSSSDSVLPTLESTRKRLLILRHSRSAFAGTTEYLFQHNLMREVAYESVLLTMRRKYHARAAGWLVTHSGERLREYLELVAEHYILAGLEMEAADYLEQAGYQAIAAGAFRSARVSLERSIELRQSTGKADGAALEAGVRLGQVLWNLGDYEASEETLKKCLSQARELEDPRLTAFALYYLSRVAASQGEFALAQDFLEQGLGPARTAGGIVLIQTLYGLGSNAWRTGDLDLAENYTNESLTLARAAGTTLQEVVALNLLGLICGGRGDQDLEQAYYEKCLALARELGDLLRQAVAIGNLGVLSIERGNYENALAYLLEGLDILQDLGRQESIVVSYTNLSAVYLRLDDTDSARHYAREALRLARQLGTIPRELNALLAWAEIAIAVGDFDQALCLIGLVLSNPVQESQVRYQANELLHTLPLDEEIIAQGLAAARDMDYEAVVANLLSPE